MRETNGKCMGVQCLTRHFRLKLKDAAALDIVQSTLHRYRYLIIQVTLDFASSREIPALS